MGPKWIAVGVVCAIILGILLSKGIDGFQNAPQNESTDINKEVCNILNDTYNSVKFNFDNMDKTNLNTANVIEAHMKGIQEQLKLQGCSS